MKLEVVKQSDYRNQYGDHLCNGKGAPPSEEAVAVWDKLKTCPVDACVIVWPEPVSTKFNDGDLRKFRIRLSGSLRRYLGRLGIKNVQVRVNVNWEDKHLIATKHARSA